MRNTTVASKKLGRWMTKNGKTQAEMGEELGVCQETVSRWVSGHALPKLKRAVDLEKKTGIKPKDWFVDKMA